MKIDHIRTRLEELGLDEEEADIYVHLQRLGQAKASDVADLADLHRSKAYRLLESLVEEGFVESTMGRPKYYVPVELDDVFTRLRRRAKQRVEVVDRIHDELADAIEDLQAEAETPEEPRVQFLSDRMEGMRRVADMIAGAKERVRAVALHEVVPSTLPKLGDLIRLGAERAAEGVDVRVVLNMDAETREAAAEVLDTDGFQVRQGEPTPIASFVLVDDEAIVWMRIDPSGKINTESDVIMVTDAPEFLKLLEMQFEATWPDADPLT